ncbi:MAG: hypothetical protein WBV85_08555 [Solirubrobacteraceae bacterium]
MRYVWLLPAFLIGALLGVGVSACGAAHGGGGSAAQTAAHDATRSEPPPSTTSSVIPPGQRLRGDGDADNPNDVDGNGDSDAASVGGPDHDSDSPTRAGYKFPDSDDKATFAFGHSPSTSDRRAIVGVVRRYYAAAAAGDGAEACTLLVPSFAGSVVEDYGGASGPSYLQGGKTCQAVLAMLFRHFHGELAEAITMVEVRVEAGAAQVVISSRTMPASRVLLARQGNSWKVSELLGQPLP